jgi:hypothetical protein
MREYPGDHADPIGVLSDVVGVLRSLLGGVAGAIGVLQWAIPVKRRFRPDFELRESRQRLFQKFVRRGAHSLAVAA